LFQAQLRAFIPLMLKYSKGRGKPGWGKESKNPKPNLGSGPAACLHTADAEVQHGAG
jgi:hypothetical protein